MVKKINNSGFSLIEMLIVMGIFIMFAGTIAEMLMWGNHGKDVVFEQLSKQNDGRIAIQNFLNDLRRSSYSSIGAYPIELAGANQIIFYSNIDTDSWKERVRYFVATTTLKRGITKPSGNPLSYNSANEVTTEVAHDLNNTTTIFYYYDQSYDGINNTSTLSAPVDISKIRMVGIKLFLDLRPNVSPAPLYIEGKTEIRNLKSN
ncbi:MAG: type II secretion system protein [Candidatus Magasanikbacteria bacterium]|nr:type II secretion system protein [Candidatus Magasanikbacteria bacterium]